MVYLGHLWSWVQHEVTNFLEVARQERRGEKSLHDAPVQDSETKRLTLNSESLTSKVVSMDKNSFERTESHLVWLEGGYEWVKPKMAEEERLYNGDLIPQIRYCLSCWLYTENVEMQHAQMCSCFTFCYIKLNKNSTDNFVYKDKSRSGYSLVSEDLSCTSLLFVRFLFDIAIFVSCYVGLIINYVSY